MNTQVTIPESMSPLALLEKFLNLYQENKRVEQASHRKSIGGYFAFRVGERNLLIDIEDVAEVAQSVSTITPLPFSPNWLLGLSGIRGEVYLTIDLKKLFNKDISVSKKNDLDSSYIILKQVLGYVFKVDAVIGIRECDVSYFVSEEKFIDGKGEINGEEFFTINLSELTNDESLAQNIH